MRFDEEWIVMGKRDRTKGYEVRVVNWGKLINTSLLRFLSPSIFRDKDASFLAIRKALLTWGSYDLLQGRRALNYMLKKYHLCPVGHGTQWGLLNSGVIWSYLCFRKVTLSCHLMPLAWQVLLPISQKENHKRVPDGNNANIDTWVFKDQKRCRWAQDQFRYFHYTSWGRP